MEKHYGWRGICVEAQSNQMWMLAHRRCKLVMAVAGQETGDEVTFSNSGGPDCGFNAGCAGIVGSGMKNQVGRLIPDIIIEGVPPDEESG